MTRQWVTRGRGAARGDRTGGYGGGGGGGESGDGTGGYRGVDHRHQARNLAIKPAADGLQPRLGQGHGEGHLQGGGVWGGRGGGGDKTGRYRRDVHPHRAKNLLAEPAGDDLQLQLGQGHDEAGEGHLQGGGVGWGGGGGRGCMSQGRCYILSSSQQELAC